MNAETHIADPTEGGAPGAMRLGRLGMDGFIRVRRQFDEVEAALEAIVATGDRTASRAARKLQRQLLRTEPSLTFIGQIKAGKTSLVNALVGWPDLLPADVNPWTSVVTSIHLSPRGHLGGDRATFRFFGEEEWGRLLTRGGRLGELAGRAGADEEMAKVTAQLARMREKSRRRLGNKFEMLMGQEHDYGYVDSELVERYVCLGDDFESDTETSSAQGRFADITRSADLYLQRDDWPLDLCIRDTPGVNDTFMIREQITIRAIRESRLCVVVLSAHQALSTVDLALMRIIATLDAREVLIFVNRIDELADPARQVPEIRDSIERTLAAHDGPVGAEVVFGSALWATHAMVGPDAPLPEAAAVALRTYAAGVGTDLGVHAGSEPDAAAVWTLSGIPALMAAVGDRVASGIGAEALRRAAGAGLNLLSGLTVQAHVARSSGVASDPVALAQALGRIETATLGAFDTGFDVATASLRDRLNRSHASFLDRATASLINSLERNGDTDAWQYDATGLRVLMRGAYQVFARNAQKHCTTTRIAAAQEVRALYDAAFDLPGGVARIEPPSPPRVPPPVDLGQTIALDLSAGWWSRWWRRRKGYRSFADDFARMIEAETAPILSALVDRQAEAVRAEARAGLLEFFAGQRATLDGLTARAANEPPRRPAADAPETLTLDAARAVLERIADGPE